MSSTPMKSNRGAPRSPIPKDDMHVSVDASVALHFRMKFLDPVTKATRKGALSELVNRLLREEMARDMENRDAAS